MTDKNLDFEFFESQLPELLKEHRNQFVLIKDQAIQGFYLSMEEALRQGYEKFGQTNFLIQEVTDEKRVHYVNSAFIGGAG
jgi:hypothetical protein